MFMRNLLAVAVVVTATNAAPAQDKVDFEKQIQPIFAEHCIKCHGEKQASGKMSLHTSAGLKEKWEADKELLIVGDPDESELYQRLVLPVDDKKRMPRMADPLPKEKIDLIAAWIKQGAVLPNGTAAPAAEAPAEATESTETEEPADAPLPDVEPAPKEAIDKLAAAGAQVMPLYADSSLLQISFAHRGEPAGDEEIALLAGVADQAYALNLADAKPSEGGLAPLAELKNLAILHLERSAVKDVALAHLSGLKNLQYLNLYGTEITDEGLKHLAALKRLERLYLWQTKVSYDAAMSMEKDVPGLIVNLGYDHPMVVKARLTKELEQVKKQAEEAKAEESKLQQQLDAAKKNAEVATARQAEIEKQLKGLEQPEAATADAEKPAEAEKSAESKKPAEEAKADAAETPKEGEAAKEDQSAEGK